MHTISGKDLVGLKYKPLFPYFSNTQNAFQVLAGDFVTTEDGTGIVHIAPGFGEDDQNLCKKHNIHLVCPVDNRGMFDSSVHNIQYNLANKECSLSIFGKQVFDTNDEIIKYLKSQNLWIKTEQYIHNYPHCWRTDTPLIYKAVSSWYVKVTDIRDRMVELNQQVNWIPSHVKDGIFGKWIQNARDWSISRNRFWGCPIPVWKSTDSKYPRIDVYGSISEIIHDFGEHYQKSTGRQLFIKDLHRPFIDTLTRPNPDDPSGKSMMVRVEDVLDCWFESGSMPYASIHYPFEFIADGKTIRSKEENKLWFNEHSPADFIVEYVAQTRGWFYTMFVLSVALFDRIPFKNCICHGVILDEKSEKLSKRLKNYPDPHEMFNQYGSDAMRFLMARSSVMYGNEFNIDKKGDIVREVARTTLSALWNTFTFFKMYFDADFAIYRQSKERLSTDKFLYGLESPIMIDVYIISKLHKTVDSIKKAMDNYDTPTACAIIENFLDVLNNWYIRRSRKRFWSNIKIKRTDFEKCIANKVATMSDEKLDSKLVSEIRVANHQPWRVQYDIQNQIIVFIDNDKFYAYKTLYTVLSIFCVTIAPLLPCVTEKIFLELDAL